MTASPKTESRRKKRRKAPLLLFFTRKTSGPARRMESLIAHFARKERRRLRVVCVDMDENAELADRLSVEDVPTIVLLKEKRAVDRLEGRATGLQIEEMISAHVDAPASPVFGEAGGVDGDVDTQYPKAS